MATGAMRSGVQLDSDKSKIINETTARALKLSVQEINSIPDNVTVWIQTYNKNPSKIGDWIKSRLTNATKPRQYSVLCTREWNES